MTGNEWENLNSEEKNEYAKLKRKESKANIILVFEAFVLTLIFLWQVFEIYICLCKNYFFGMWIRLLIGVGLLLFELYLIKEMLMKYRMAREGKVLNFNGKQNTLQEINMIVSLFSIVVLIIADINFRSVAIGTSTLWGRMMVNIFCICNVVCFLIFAIKDKQMLYFVGIIILLVLLWGNITSSSGICDIYADLKHGTVTQAGEIQVIIRSHSRDRNNTYISFVGENGETYEMKSRAVVSKRVAGILEIPTESYRNVGYGKITYYPNTGIIVNIEK